MRTPVIPTGTYIFYESFERMLSLLTPDDELTVRRAISAYVFGKELPEMSDQACIAFEAIAPQLDANQKKRENGKKGGRPRKDATAADCDEPQLHQSLNRGYAEAETSGYENTQTTHTPKTKPNINVNVNANVNENVNNTPQTPQGADTSKPTLSQTQLKRFERWYSKYPRHIARGAAEKAWKKLNPDEEFTEKMIRAVEDQQGGVWRDTEPQYIPHPATWLNQKRWEDDASPPHSRGRTGDVYTDWSEDIAKYTMGAADAGRVPADAEHDSAGSRQSWDAT